jgi:toxin ParE1/3/4
MKRARVTAGAKRDLEEIWSYIGRDDALAATRFVDKLNDRFLLIGASPQMGRTRDELESGLRSHAIGNYLIYYREKAAAVFILRVVHGARIPKQFFNT